MTDIHVETEIFAELKDKLKNCYQMLDDSANTLKQNVRVAGDSLEGNQYSLSVQETDASCKVITASVENMKSLEEHLGKLEEHVNTYLSCKYEG